MKEYLEKEVYSVNISDHITQQQFKEIMVSACQKGKESENMEAKDLINMIKEQIINVISSSRDDRRREQNCQS